MNNLLALLSAIEMTHMAPYVPVGHRAIAPSQSSINKMSQKKKRQRAKWASKK